MKLIYEKICVDNIMLASKIQYKIFPNSSAYQKYLKEIKDNYDLPISFLVYYNDIPIGVVGLYDIPIYEDTIWLSWFGVLEEYRYKGFGLQILNIKKHIKIKMCFYFVFVLFIIFFSLLYPSFLVTTLTLILYLIIFFI